MIYYIWDRERNQWWKDRLLGYTPNILHAGQYSGEEALDIICHATPPGQTVIVPENQVRMKIWGTDITPLRDTEESLTQEYETWLEANNLDKIESGSSAEELLAVQWLTDGQRSWLTEFIKRWEAVV